VNCSKFYHLQTSRAREYPSDVKHSLSGNTHSALMNIQQEIRPNQQNAEGTADCEAQTFIAEIEQVQNIKHSSLASMTSELERRDSQDGAAQEEGAKNKRKLELVWISNYILQCLIYDSINAICM